MRLISSVLETTFKNQCDRLDTDIETTYEAQDDYYAAVVADAAGSTAATQAAVAAALVVLNAAKTIQGNHQTKLWLMLNNLQNESP